MAENETEVTAETVRGTEEDAKNYILQAITVYENGQYGKAEKLLLKSERIFPTEVARDLLEEVRATKSEVYFINATKCLTAFHRNCTRGNLEKAEKLLNKAKKFDPSIDMEKQLSLLEVAKTNKEKANTECKTTDEGLYKSMKAYDADDLLNDDQFSLQAKEFDPTLNLEYELSNIGTKEATGTESNINPAAEELKNLIKTKAKKTDARKYKKRATGYFDNASKTYDAGEFKEIKVEVQKQKEMESQSKEELEKSKIRHDDKPEIIKSFEDQEDDIEKNKDDEGKPVKNDKEGGKSDKDDETHKATHDPNEDAKKASRPSDEATISKTIKSDDDLKRERLAEMFIIYAVDAIISNRLDEARQYLERLLQRQSNEEARALLREVERQKDRQNNNESHSLSRNDRKLEANEFLDKAERNIQVGDLESAMSVLINSWDMFTSQRTTSIYKTFLEARLALSNRNRSDGTSETVTESDELAILALVNYQNNKLDQARDLLIEALKLNSCILSNKLLVEIRRAKVRGCVSQKV